MKLGSVGTFLMSPYFSPCFSEDRIMHETQP